MTIHDTPYGKFVLEPEDGVCNHIKKGEFWDLWLKEHLDGLTKDQVAVDCGSHIGFHTVYMAKRCKHVYSFEPQNINLDRLVENVRLNGLNNVTCYNVALYSKNTKMAVNNVPDQKIIPYNSGGNSACSLSMFENEKGDVEAKTLDSFNFEKIDFIKMDCETLDKEVILGGVETIKKYRPAIIYECGDLRTQKELIDWFKNINYNVKEVAGQNYLATPKY